MKQVIPMSLRHQNIMLAVRREMGWPAFKPANDCIAFCAGRSLNFQVGSEMARIAELLGKDAVYSGWKNATAKLPDAFTIVFRELLTVDIVDRVVPYAANDDAPIVFVSSRKDEHFAIDRRGSLARVPGRPKDIGTGRKLAMKRIRATAAMLGDEMLAGNRFVPWGSQSIEPDAPCETIVRFG